MADNVILVGFMGAGKSSVGRILARRLGRCFVETDEMITATEGRSIPEIFAEKGEAHFRALEDEVVRLLALKRGDVIATGRRAAVRRGPPRGPPRHRHRGVAGRRFRHALRARAPRR